MTSYRDLSIKTKLSLIALLTCVTAMGLACAALFVYEVQSFKRTLVSDLKAQATTLAGLSTAALTFDDSTAAGEMLGELKSQKHIKWAIIFKKNKTFAHYLNPDAAGIVPDQPPTEYGERFRADGLFLHNEILLKGERIGTIYLCADTSQLRARLSEYAIILLAVFLASSLVALLMASRLQRAIVGPVRRLADTARVIAQHQDYSVRVEQLGLDELGRLTGAFNQMLNRIQAQDSAVREGRERFEVAVAGARDGIWDWDLVTQETYLSPQWKAMLGYDETELASSRDVWRGLYHPDDGEASDRALKEYLDGKRASYEIEHRMRHKDGSYRWILTRGAALRNAEGRPYRMAGSITDITERKQASDQIARMQRELVDASRMAGMAEVATGVLHNVGNVLNSVNVSATLIMDQLRKSKTSGLAKAVQLLSAHKDNVGEFLTHHPKGKVLPSYFEALAEQLTREQLELASEMQGLQQNIEHIKQIVTMQQSYAKVSGATEKLPPEELFEDALRMSATGLNRHHIQVNRQFEPVPPVVVDRHKVLQILVNLLANAKQALKESPQAEKRIALSIAPAAAGRVRLSVRDNGCGIEVDNLVKVFRHGFTTKKDGHGFGLHSCANAAKEMGGALTVDSDGPGTGATFNLELPIAADAALPRAA